MTKTPIRLRVFRGHLKDCESRALSAGWGSAWWLDGARELRSQTGRKTRHANQTWLRARCIFSEKCPAEAFIAALDITDAVLPVRRTR